MEDYTPKSSDLFIILGIIDRYTNIMSDNCIVEDTIKLCDRISKSLFTFRYSFSVEPKGKGAGFCKTQEEADVSPGIICALNTGILREVYDYPIPGYEPIQEAIAYWADEKLYDTYGKPEEGNIVLAVAPVELNLLPLIGIILAEGIPAGNIMIDPDYCGSFNEESKETIIACAIEMGCKTARIQIEKYTKEAESSDGDMETPL